FTSLSTTPRPPTSTLFPYTTLFRSTPKRAADDLWWQQFDPTGLPTCSRCSFLPICWGGCPKKHLEQDEHAIAEQGAYWRKNLPRSEEHTSELQSPYDLVCRLLLEKK